MHTALAETTTAAWSSVSICSVSQSRLLHPVGTQSPQSQSLQIKKFLSAHCSTVFVSLYVPLILTACTARGDLIMFERTDMFSLHQITDKDFWGLQLLLCNLAQTLRAFVRTSGEAAFNMRRLTTWLNRITCSLMKPAASFWSYSPSSSSKEAIFSLYRLCGDLRPTTMVLPCSHTDPDAG